MRSSAWAAAHPSSYVRMVTIAEILPVEVLMCVHMVVLENLLVVF
jgi:hypothetical protein